MHDAVVFLIGGIAGIVIQRLMSERSDPTPPVHPHPFFHVKGGSASNKQDSHR